MSDEIFIHNFLEKNFKITTAQVDFMVTDLYDEHSYNMHDFILFFRKIIGNYNLSEGNKTSIDLFHEWFRTNKKRLTKKLFDYFELMDCELGSNALVPLAIDNLSDSGFHHNFISNCFNDFYTEKIIKPLLTEYVSKFNKNYDSQKLIDDFSILLYKESAFQHAYAVTFLNTWYCSTIIKNKVDDFLSQLVITLGRTNWVVTWIGHGPVTDITIKNHFKKENSFQFNYVKGLYQEWYDNEVIERSERLMKFNVNE